MFSHRHQILFFFLILTSVSFAEEAHEPAAAEVKTSLPDWVPVETKIQELHSKIKSKEATVLKLIEDKNQLPNKSPKLKAIVDEIVKEHKELQNLIVDYKKNLNILKYRFPERNAKAERKYDRIEEKSLDEMELAIGIDGKLNRNLKKMRTQFQSETHKKATQQTATIEAPVKKNKKEKSIDEADAVILQK